MVASVEVPKFNIKKCFESLGWLLSVEEDDNISLLDPFSCRVIPLPHQNTFPEYITDLAPYEHAFIQKMVLSSSSSNTLDFVLMVIVGDLGDLGFWRLGDKAWNKINKQEIMTFTDVVYYGNGQFYAIGYPGVVWVYELSENDNHVEGRVILCCKDIVPDFRSLYSYIHHYSMNLYIPKAVDNILLIIVRSSPILSHGFYYMTSKFQVYEVDLVTRKRKKIHSLGSMAVFLGENSTIAVDASRFTGDVKIKANQIYFTDDDWEFNYSLSAKGGGKNIRVYNLKTETVEPIHLGDRFFSLTKFCIPLWIIPRFSNSVVDNIWIIHRFSNSVVDNIC